MKALFASYRGEDSSEQMPIEYAIHVWRRKMHVSWQEAMATPIAVITRDLEYISIENTIRSAVSKNSSNA